MKPNAKVWRIGFGLALGLLFCLVVVTGLFYPLILTWMARFLTLSQQPEPADLILVLGGDFYGPRVLKGAELGARGYAPKVLISGPLYQNRPQSDFAIRFLVEKGYPKSLFLGFLTTADSTIEESIDDCGELRRLAAGRVLLVTSAYHSRRANVVFRLFCPSLTLRSVAATDPEFEPENWWKTPRYRLIFFSEWKKLLGTVFWKYPAYMLHRLGALVTGRQ
jgi:uncharacterized SAM-binding protein YcdF (DUF218 family)